MKEGWYYLALDEAEPVGPFPTEGEALARWKALSLLKTGGDPLAFDRTSVRSYDADGRMHVSRCHISKANVCEYYGREIPGADALGLEPDKKYKLWRHPDELKKAAPTFDNLPLLSRHVATDVNDHHPDLVVGSTGTDAEFVDPHLDNSLVIWSRDGIEGIESEYQKELSCAYRYRAEMTPGKTPDGEAYDGIMRDIVGNHVALVREGRAGSDVVVGDSAIPKLKETFEMGHKLLSRKGALAQGGLIALLQPKLAQDAKVDLSPALEGITSKTFKESIPVITKSVGEIIKTKLRSGVAFDASLGEVTSFLNALEGVETPEGGMDEPTAMAMPKPAGVMDNDPEEFLKGKLSAEDKAAYDKMCADKAAKDKAAKDAEEDDEDEEDEEEKKKAMDAAVSSAVTSAVTDARKEERAIRAAEREVRPYVGELAMSFDSAEGVYRQALKMLNVADADKIDKSALPTILRMQPLPGARPQGRIAMDAEAVKGFHDRFPEAARINRL